MCINFCKSGIVQIDVPDIVDGGVFELVDAYYI
jgi:hypothetical protein